MSDGKRLFLTVLLAAWALAFGYAFVAFATMPPEGDGFLRGANRVMAYLGWQGIAGMLALAVFGVGWSWPRGSPVRRLSWVPLGLAVLHVAAILAIILWARFSH